MIITVILSILICVIIVFFKIYSNSEDRINSYNSSGVIHVPAETEKTNFHSSGLIIYDNSAEVTAEP